MDFVDIVVMDELSNFCLNNSCYLLLYLLVWLLFFVPDGGWSDLSVWILGHCKMGINNEIIHREYTHLNGHYEYSWFEWISKNLIFISLDECKLNTFWVNASLLPICKLSVLSMILFHDSNMYWCDMFN